MRRTLEDTGICGVTSWCRSTIDRTVWDGNQLLWELRQDGTGDTQKPGEGDYTGVVGYVHGGEIDAPLGMLRDGQTYSIHLDWRGMPAFATDTAGNQYGCDPVYQVGCEEIEWPARTWTSHLGSDSREKPLWFGSLVTSQKDATGLLYRRNRYYDPATGQFTQQDPIGIAGGLNLYGYAGGDPINFSDPFGLMGCDPPDKPCTVSALFFGISATAHIGPTGGTGGASVGITLNGLDSQVFIQVDGGVGVGPGLYVGGGGHAGLQRMSVDPETDNITSGTAGYGFVTANAGAGPSGGGTVAVSNDGNLSGTIAPRAGLGGGAGVQAMVGAGASRTIAFPSLRSFLRGLLDDDEPGR